MIQSGEKTDEYRERKDYWAVRLSTQSKSGWRVFKDFDTVTFKNGYAKDSPVIKFECLGISIGTGKPEWGAKEGKEYYVIKLGKKL